MKLKYKELSSANTKIFIHLTLLTGDDVPNYDDIYKLSIASQIVDKRINAFGLPIKFTKAALLSISIFVDIPGEAIVFLIDALNKFENKTVTVQMIATELYPYGFYDQESFEWYVENKIKTKEIKWAEIY